MEKIKELIDQYKKEVVQWLKITQDPKTKDTNRSYFNGCINSHTFIIEDLQKILNQES